MIKEFLLVFLAITQQGGIGLNVHEKTFPSMEMCGEFIENEFLEDGNWTHVHRTWNFYNSTYQIDIKNSNNGDMRIYYGCVEKKQECGFFWPCGEINMDQFKTYPDHNE